MNSMQTVPTPQVLYNELAEPIEVVFSYEQFERFARWLAARIAWEDLPPFWQDAIDRLAIKDGRDEQARPLRELITESSIEI